MRDTVNSRNEEKTSSKKTIIAVVAVLLTIGMCVGGVLLSRSANATLEQVEIVEFADLASLQSVPKAEFLKDTSRLYKVGADYYSYFPSTGCLELLTSAKAYDTMSLSLIEDMYADLPMEPTNDEVVVVKTLENYRVFSQAVDDRVDYIQKELDNANANLLLDNENQEMIDYRAQLEAELEELLKYHVSTSEHLSTFMSCLGTDEAQAALTAKINEVVNSNFETIAESQKFATSSDTASLKKALRTQTEITSELSKKIATIDDSVNTEQVKKIFEQMLVDKRISLESANDTIAPEDMQVLTGMLDKYVDNYVQECNKEVIELSTKVDALEDLYNTLSGYDSSSTEHQGVLTEIRSEYTSLINEQQSIVDRITYLESISESVSTSTDTASQDKVSEELLKQQQQLETLQKIIDENNLTNVESLASEQEKITEAIKKLEEAQALQADTISKEQLKMLENLNTELKSLSEKKVDLEEYGRVLSVLNNNIDVLDVEVEDSVNKLEDMIETSNAKNDDALNKAVLDIKTELDNAVNTQNSDLGSAVYDIRKSLEDAVSKAETDDAAVLDEVGVLLLANAEASTAEVNQAISDTMADVEVLLAENETKSQEELSAEIDKIMQKIEDVILDYDTKITALDEKTTANLEQTEKELSKIITDLGNSSSEEIKTVKETLEKLVSDIDTENDKALVDTKMALETVIANIDTENDAELASVKTELKELIDKMGVSKSEEIDKAISEVKTLLANSEAKSEEELQEAIDKAMETVNNLLEANETLSTSQINGLSTEIEAKLQAAVVSEDAKFDAVNSLIADLEANIDRQADNIAKQEEALTALVDTTALRIKSEMQDSLNASVRKQEADLATEKQILEALMTTKDTELKDEIQEILDNHAAGINTLNSGLSLYKTEVSNTFSTLENDIALDIADLVSKLNDTNSDVTDVNAAVEALKTKLADSVEQGEQNLAADKSALEAMINAKNEALRKELDALKSDVTANTSAITGVQSTASDNKQDIADLEAGLSASDSLLGAVQDKTNANEAGLATTNAQLNSTNTKLTTLTNDVVDLSDAYRTYYSEYTQYTGNTDAALVTLNTKLTALENSYNDYVTSNGQKIADIEALITVVKQTTNTNAASILQNERDITALDNALQSLNTSMNNSISDLDTRLSNEIADLKTIVNNNYTTVLTELSALDTRVTALETLTSSHTTQISANAAQITTLVNNFSTLETKLTTLEGIVATKADITDIPAEYVLPNATTISTGGVKVDGNTILVDSDGVISVNLDNLPSGGNSDGSSGGSIIGGGLTESDAIKVGSTWENYDDIPVELRPYCIQANFYGEPCTPALTYGTTASTRYHYTKWYESTWGTGWLPNGQGSSSGGVSEVPVLFRTYHAAGYKHYVSKVPPANGSYGMCEVIDVTEYWYEYKVAEDAPVTRVTYAVDYGRAYPFEGEFTIVEEKTATHAYGHPDNAPDGYGVDTYNNVKIVATNVPATAPDDYGVLRWFGDYDAYGPDSGFVLTIVTDCSYSGCELNATQRKKMWEAGVFTEYYSNYVSSNYSGEYRYYCINGTSSKTGKVVPTSLVDGYNSNRKTGETYGGYVENVYNFTNAGIAFKIAFLYGNHIWMYCGTPV